jgi:hypothetical protein
MTKNPMDPIHRRIVMGTNAGGEIAIRRAHETATPLVVWDDGEIREISAEEASRRHRIKTKEFVTDKNQ